MESFQFIKNEAEPNAMLKLHAGVEIDLKPGTHIKAGAMAHLWIHYEGCDRYPRPCSVSNISQQSLQNESGRVNTIQSENEILQTDTSQTENTINVYPNPARQSFTIISKQSKITSIGIYSIMGRKVGEIPQVNSKRVHYTKPINSGTYILIIKTKERRVYHKKIVIL